MRIIGVTGGIGSGKSTVSEILARLGAKIIDADIIAREIVRKGEPALDEIVNFFGTGILKEDGELDRKKLGDIVFKNNQKLSVLNKITHMYITEHINKAIDEFQKNKQYDTLVVDAAIPFEHGFMDVVDEIWVVSAKKEVRAARIMRRNGFSYEEALDRINSQKSESEYLGIADKILENNGDASHLEAIVRELFYNNVRVI